MATAKVAKKRPILLCIPAIWHTAPRPASVDCLGRCGPLFCHPDAYPIAGVPTMAAFHPNSFKARKSLKVGGKNYTYFSLSAVAKEVGDLSRLPYSLRIL